MNTLKTVPQDECPERTVMQVLPIQGTFIVVRTIKILV